jgi:hypothetical protein
MGREADCPPPERGVGKLVTMLRYEKDEDAGQCRAAAMSAVIPTLAVVTLVLLSFVAKQRTYLMTSDSLVFLAGAVAILFVFARFG